MPAIHVHFHQLEINTSHPRDQTLPRRGTFCRPPWAQEVMMQQEGRQPDKAEGIAVQIPLPECDLNCTTGRQADGRKVQIRRLIVGL